MKVCKKTLLLASIALVSQITFAHGLTEADLANISRAYGYVTAQETVLKQIDAKYPALKSELFDFDLAWISRFPNAQESLVTHFKCFGVTEADVIKEMKSNDKNSSLSKQLKVQSQHDAKQRLDYFKYRLSHPSNFDREIFSTLNDVCFSKHPEKEFSRDKQTYSSLNHPKSNGLDVRISMPASWKKSEGRRPHIVQKWTKNDESQHLTTMLLVISAPDVQPYWNDKELKEEIKDGRIWDLFDDSGEFIQKRKPIFSRIEGIPCVILNAVTKHQRAAYSAYMDMSCMYFMFKGNLVIVQFAVSAKAEKEAMNLSKKYTKLRNLIFNSVYLPQKHIY